MGVEVKEVVMCAHDKYPHPTSPFSSRLAAPGWREKEREGMGEE